MRASWIFTHNETVIANFSVIVALVGLLVTPVQISVSRFDCCIRNRKPALFGLESLLFEMHDATQEFFQRKNGCSNAA